MPWGKGTVVTGAKGFVFLSGNTATADDYEPFKKGGGAVGDAAAQWRNILTNIKSDLGSVLNKDSSAVGVVIQGFRIEGGLDEEATLLAERCRVEAD